MHRRPGVGRKLALKLELAARDAREQIGDRLASLRPTVTLEQTQRRLELFLAALYGRPIAIEAAGDTPGVKGESIQLPASLPAPAGMANALTRYRLFAVEQAERLVRGTAAQVPADPLVRDLYLLREAKAIDARIAREQHGLRDALVRERAVALRARARVRNSTPSEHAVERLMRQSLASDPLTADQPETSPAESVAWAEREAERIRSSGARYDGVRPAQLWGTIQADTSTSANTWRREHARPMEHVIQRKYSWGRTEVDSEAATGRTNEASEKYANERGDPSNEVGGESGSTRPGAGTGPGPLARPDLEGLPPAVWYDEWDVFKGAYRKQVAGVRLHDSNEGSAEWADDALRDNAALVRKVRHQFERLRARRTLLRRQRSGDEIDVAAMVGAMTDRRMGQGGDDRLYMAARPARRGLAIALLADASGSTKAPVSEGRAIIDLERIALLLACEALDALGDRYAAYAFAGKSAENVALTCVKDFREQSGTDVRRRISAIEPGGFTRLGAAVRHATAQLAVQSAGHRLLLLLSDGRPNDLDWYQGDYGIEDSRQAILEARASGVYPFCLTIDAEASEYLPRIFGASGHTILTRAEQLPTALLGVVRGVVRRG